MKRFRFGEGRSSFRGKVANILENREPLYAILSVVAGRRAKLLRSAQLKSSGKGSNELKLAVAEKAWSELSMNYTLRARVYAPNPLARVKSFLRLCARHGYGVGGVRTFDKRAMIKHATPGAAWRRLSLGSVAPLPEPTGLVRRPMKLTPSNSAHGGLRILSERA